VIRIAITVEAFEAIVATMQLGPVGFENATNERGERLIWLDPTVVSRLRSLRGPGESYRFCGWRRRIASDCVFRTLTLDRSQLRYGGHADFRVETVSPRARGRRSP
jgi:hypothetical protein